MQNLIESMELEVNLGFCSVRSLKNAILLIKEQQKQIDFLKNELERVKNERF